MKSILSLSALVLLSFTLPKSTPAHLPAQSTSDSSLINHRLDGSVKEWPSTAFKTDNETGIEYAFDNNSTNFFIAMNISNYRTQLKMMREGMTMYIDLKGKKKESKGIEFPVKNGSPEMNEQNYAASRKQNGDQPITEQQRKYDIRAMRKMMALNLVEMKVFGLVENAPDDQQLLLPGSANIAFSWDSSDVMHIEYLIPLSLLGDISSLDQKDISIGWKIHAVEMPKPTEGSENSTAETRPSGGGRGGGGYGGGGRRGGGSGGGYSGGGNRSSQGSGEKVMGEQKFWTKYVIAIPATKKAF